MSITNKVNGKKLSIGIIIGLAITFGGVQAQVIANKETIKELKPNIVRIAKMEERVKALINVTPETLESVIATYMNDSSLCVTKGQECFDWMHTNYTHQKIADYWINKLEGLL